MAQKSRTEFQTTLAVALAAAGLSQRDLARKLRVADTTLSDWIRGVHPRPEWLAVRLEKLLRLSAGSLTQAEPAPASRSEPAP